MSGPTQPPPEPARDHRTQDGPTDRQSQRPPRGRHLGANRSHRSRYLIAVVVAVFAATAGIVAVASGDSFLGDPSALPSGEPSATASAPATTADPTPTLDAGPRGGDPPNSSADPAAPDDNGGGFGNGDGTTGPAGWPGPDNTGVPAGTDLKSSSSLTIKDAGTVVSGLDIDGCVTIAASNVTIEKSRITCGGLYPVKVEGGVTGVLLEDVEIDGEGVTSTAICCGNYTLRRVNIHSTIDGPRLGSNTVVEDSWIHHLSRQEGSHNDTLQTTEGVNIVVRNNRLEPYNPNTDDPFNAAIMIGSTTGPAVRDLLFENNYCNGGNYTIGIRADLNASNIVFRGNTFGRDFRYGVVARYSQSGINWADNNVFADTGDPVVET